jgi:hypothetical protein
MVSARQSKCVRSDRVADALACAGAAENSIAKSSAIFFEDEMKDIGGPVTVEKIAACANRTARQTQN